MSSETRPYDQLSFEDHARLEFHDEYRRKKAEYVKQFLPKGGRLLDVGCGSGFDLRHLADDTSSLVGVDLSMNMLTQAGAWTKQSDKPVMFVQADAKSLPFRNAIFDMVHNHELSVFNGEDVTEQVRVLDEQRRVLRNGGYVVVVMPMKDYNGCSFMPSGEEQMKYLFRHAGIKFVSPVYYLGCLPWWSTPRILALLHRVLPAGVAKRFIKSPEEYLRGDHFFILGLGKKAQ